ncbi:MAG TPA: GAF domain-containing protein [Anaerolineales bacterium]|nr:GAF domain-containing protein [Anaerolineales bacterium]
MTRIAEALNRSVDLEQALSAALAQVTELLGLQTGWIWLLDEASGDSYLAAAQNLPPALADNPHRMEGACHCLDTYRAGDLEGAANINVITCSRLWGWSMRPMGCATTHASRLTPTVSSWACSTSPAPIGANSPRMTCACCVPLETC